MACKRSREGNHHSGSMRIGAVAVVCCRACTEASVLCVSENGTLLAYRRQTLMRLYWCTNVQSAGADPAASRQLARTTFLALAF
eukprot:1142127-Pelagomonas_calceolata.AAC.4